MWHIVPSMQYASQALENTYLELWRVIACLITLMDLTSSILISFKMKFITAPRSALMLEWESIL